MERRVEIDADKCVGCGICVRACAAHNLELKNKKAKSVLERCVLCGHCAAVCPNKAVSITGLENAVEKQREPRLDPKDVLDVIRFRRSIRRFKNTAVPSEVIAQIIEVGRLTHTAKNMQDVSFAVLDKRKDEAERAAVRCFSRIKPLADLLSPLARINTIDDRFFFFGAPIVIVILAKDKTNGLLAAQNMEFAAEANGLGVLFSGFFTMAANWSPKIKKIIGKPRNKRVAATLVMGYPDINYLRSAPRERADVKYL